MTPNSIENTPNNETREQKIANIEAALLKLEERESALLKMLAEEAAKTQEVEPRATSKEASVKNLTDRLRQAGKTALVTAALSFGAPTETHDLSYQPIEKEAKQASPELNESRTDSTAEQAIKFTPPPEITVETKAEPFDAEKVIAEKIENDPSIHERALKFIERMDASLLNKLSTSAKIMYLSFIEENMNAQKAGRETEVHFLVDKDQAKLYVTGENNKLIAETPVIIGASRGNGLNGVSLNTSDTKDIDGEDNGKYTTPAGVWQLSDQNPDTKYGEFQRRVLIAEAEQEQNIMIHPPLKGLSEEKSKKQRKAYDSIDPMDRYMSNGCVRAPLWFLKSYLKLMKNGTVFGVSPEKEGEIEIAINPANGLMHQIGSKEWSENQYAQILRDIERVQKEHREAEKTQK